MRTAVLVLSVMLLVSLLGCASRPQPQAQPALPPVPQPVMNPGVPAQQPVAEAAPAEQASKQLEVTGTEVKSEKPTILGDVVCRFNKTTPTEFSFKVTNIEKKIWYFKYIPTGERDTQDNPLVILNARQLNDNTMITACKRRSIGPGESVVCDFNPADNPLVRTQLFVGETGWGNLKNNSLNLKTVDHSAQVWFVCDEK